MLHGRNNENILHKKEHFFPWEKESIVPAMQHGCRAKPLLPQQACITVCCFSAASFKYIFNINIMHFQIKSCNFASIHVYLSGKTYDSKAIDYLNFYNR